MSDQYVGEIRMFAGAYAPEGWALCDGQILNIKEYQILYTVLGTTYGGDGKTTFALPDLRGRLPIHISHPYPLGASGGTETVTLLTSQLPVHTHLPLASTLPNTDATAKDSPEGAFWGNTKGITNYLENPTLNAAMNSAAVSSVGGNMAHENLMPYMVISFIISTQGIFPSAG
ncbi:phage tail protein [Cohnella boryungensis]|uniref:Phage tail protein n=1 Tax=Cohnella boryungensis TaxID=768479 RepID=A0ABV8SI03_9BACL